MLSYNAIMSKSWSNSTEYSEISSTLASSESREFERLVLPLLRFIYSDVIGVSALGTLDKKGIDALAWSDKQPYSLVVQCKGFRVNEHELGDSQTKQCLKSIDSFINSKTQSKEYLLLHNRDNRNQDFREKVNKKLQELVKTGRVKNAFLIDRQTLIRRAFDVMYQKVISYMSEFPADIFKSQFKPIEKVPLRISILKINKNFLEEEKNISNKTASPSQEILRSKKHNIILVIGRAGHGKTTSALETFSDTTKKIIYVHASKLSSNIRSSKDLLINCFKADVIFKDVLEVDLNIIKLLYRPVVKKVFGNSDSPLILIIDALDESIYFSRSGGLQFLFNQLSHVQVPVVLLARSEFWIKKRIDFESSIGLTAKDGNKFPRQTKLVELLPWTNREIVSYIKRYILSFKNQKIIVRNLLELVSIIEKDKYTKYYGDIPQNPLFLNFLVEVVSKEGIQMENKASILYKGAYIKIRRDIENPIIYGGTARETLLSAKMGSDEIIHLSFKIMMLAAYYMLEIKDGNIEMLSKCKLEKILSHEAKLSSIKDSTGIFLNTLLIPLDRKHIHKGLEVEFSHRVFQEFFLAMYWYENENKFIGIKQPPEIENIIQQIKKL
jgi:hypothetical protein